MQSGSGNGQGSLARELVEELVLALRQEPQQLGLSDYAYSITGLVLLVPALWFAARLLDRTALGRRASGSPWYLLVLLFLGVVGLGVVVLLLPKEDRTEAVQLLGLLFTVAIALSSTTLLAQATAGLMLRTVRNFELGDYLRCGEHSGRVTERGLFHVELQTEDSDLTTLPNLFLASQAVTVVRKSGTLVTGAVSLGYDIPHQQVTEVLKQAALSAELSDPIVRVRELGDYSVTYNVLGRLGAEGMEKLLSMKSRLHRAMLDQLHGAGIEIVSPAYVNRREQSPIEPVVPEVPLGPEEPETSGASLEELAFDKAEVAESMTRLEARLVELRAAPRGEDAESTSRQIERLEKAIEARKRFLGKQP